MALYLAVSGRSAACRDGMVPARGDPLCAEGEQDARALGLALKERGLEGQLGILVSDTPRAVETAITVLGEIGQRQIIEAPRALAPRDMGELVGMSWSKVKASVPWNNEGQLVQRYGVERSDRTIGNLVSLICELTCSGLWSLDGPKIIKSPRRLETLIIADPTIFPYLNWLPCASVEFGRFPFGEVLDTKLNIAMPPTREKLVH